MQWPGRAGDATPDGQEDRMQINCFVVREAENKWHFGMTGGTGQPTPLSDHGHPGVCKRTFIIHAISTSCILSEFREMVVSVVGNDKKTRVVAARMSRETFGEMEKVRAPMESMGRFIIAAVKREISRRQLRGVISGEECSDADKQN